MGSEIIHSTIVVPTGPARSTATRQLAVLRNAASAMIPCVVSRDDVEAWFSDTRFDGPVSENGHAVWIDTADGPLVVRKESGAVWRLTCEPLSRSAFGMPSVVILHRALRTAGHDPDLPDDVVPVAAPRLPAAAATPVDIDQLRAWMRTRFGWRHIDDRITDLGWAFHVTVQNDAFLDTGDHFLADVGSGPTIVVKRTRGVWRHGSGPGFIPAYEATDEHRFHAVLRALFRDHDPGKPHERLPEGT